MGIYTNPFNHGAELSTSEEIIDPEATYTIVAETDEYLAQKITFGEINDRYDVMITLSGINATRMIDTLISCDRAVMIIRGRVGSRRDLPTVIPAGYVYPDGSWFRVTDQS